MRKRILAIVLVVMLMVVSVPISSSASNPYGSVSRRAFVLTAPFDGILHPIVNPTDFFGIQEMFSNFASSYGTPVSCTGYQQPSNGTLEGVGSLHSKFTTRFASADANDINYVYIAAHGDQNTGNLYINGSESDVVLTMLKLRQWLDGYDGHFIVMIDSCFSGHAIGRGAGENEETEQESIASERAAQIMMDSFLLCDEDPNRSGEFADRSKYTVFCSSLSTQSSYINPNVSSTYAYATYAWAKGLGYDITDYQSCPQAADSNNDGVVTAKELYNYSYNLVHYYKGNAQTVCYYSASPYYSVFYRKPTTSIPAGPLGDVTLDEQITMADVLLVRKFITGDETPNYTQSLLADMNGDGGIYMSDALAIQQYIAAM